MRLFKPAPSAAVVIPVYKPDLSPSEEAAFRQCCKILQDHPIVLIKPWSLSVDIHRSIHPTLIEQSFDDTYFSDTRGYNRLMLSAEFYEQFLSYDYILIHQLDAFVFKDELSHWCKKGYDYIGAPWLVPPCKGSLRRRIAYNRLLRRVYKDNIKQPGSHLPVDLQVANRVGNGGFSLRKSDALYRICRQQQPMIDHYNRHNTHHFYNEDVFWSLEVNRSGRQLAIPDYKKAVRFSIEFLPEYAFELNKGDLPFGCHAWLLNADFWNKIFRQFNYEIYPT